MSFYVIAQVDIRDREEYNKYVAGFRAMFADYRGEVLVADEAPQVIEGEWPWTKTVVIRFDDEAEAKRWYHSPQYQAAAKFRFKSANTNVIMAKGIR
jgi:uncharacterized protein (DUF1330 family)